MGPSFHIQFSVKFLKFYGNWGWFWRNVIRFTANDHWNIGGRIPALYTDKDGMLVHYMTIDNNGNMRWKQKAKENHWYKIEYLQYKHDSKQVNIFNL